eukprot:gene1095-1188_t
MSGRPHHHQMEALMNYNAEKLPKLIAFDLDGTIWSPDMYELWGGGAPFRIAGNGKDLIDCAGTSVRLLGVTDRILHDLRTDPALAEVKVAWVSCTDEPEWAAECLEKFSTAGGERIGQVVHSSEIYKANKQTHFRNLQKKFPHIDYSDMLFFDNEYGNIESVSRLGVKCYLARQGMTCKAWQDGLKMFE